MIIDATTQKPPVVSGADTPWPSIRLPLDQVPQLRALLDRHGLRHTLDDETISMNGGPDMAEVGLPRGADARAVQLVLDNARGDRAGE